MNSIRNRLLGGGALLAAGLMLSPGLAHATPYAFASDQITNFVITAPTGSATITGGQDVTSNNAQFAGFPSSSTEDPATTTGTSDALHATSGPGAFPGQNDFGQALKSATTTGTRADSFAQGANLGSAGTASTVAEGHGNALGSSNANDKAAINLNVSVASGTTLNFAFNAKILLEALTASLPGEFASSSVLNTITVRTEAGALVFDYAPTRLQASTTSSNGVPPDALLSDSGAFTATTDSLAAGNYVIALTTNASESILNGTASPVPEPVSLALLGTGLIGLGVARRRRAI